MTCATYHRVSTVDQDETLARDELRIAAAARGLTIAHEIEETGSGARNDRPGLQHVMDLARKRRITHVLVWKLDRFGRSSIDVLGNVQELERLGVTFICTSQGIEVGPGAGPIGRLVLGVMAAVAEFERNVLIERTRLGVAKARANGKQIGGVRVMPLTVVDRAVALRATRLSWGDIRAQLAREGLGEHPRTAIERAVSRARKTVVKNAA